MFFQTAPDPLTQVIIPIILGVLSTITTLVVTLFVTLRSEQFRKLFLWESYAKDLWDKQVETCIELLSTAQNATTSAMWLSSYKLLSIRHGTIENGKNLTEEDLQRNENRMSERLNTHYNELYAIKPKRLAVCTSKLNQVADELESQIFRILISSKEALVPDDLPKVQKFHLNLIDAVRKELNIERLDAQTRLAIEEATKKIVEKDPLLLERIDL